MIYLCGLSVVFAPFAFNGCLSYRKALKVDAKKRKKAHQCLEFCINQMLSIQTERLPRAEALRRIRLLSGKDLRPMATQFGITVWKSGRKNKGWAGHVIERYLGLPQNSLQSPDFGSWELKVVPLRRAADGTVRVKESMAITMIEPGEVVANTFADSHLYDKLRSMIVVARLFENVEETSSVMHSAAEFDLDNPLIRKQVEEDYETHSRDHSDERPGCFDW